MPFKERYVLQGEKKKVKRTTKMKNFRAGEIASKLCKKTEVPMYQVRSLAPS